jgi:hypothetical protein
VLWSPSSFRVGALVFALLCATSEARAECIALAGSPICNSFERATSVFLADVENVRTILAEPSFRIEVRFRLLEVFKGTRVVTQTLQFASSIDSYQFQTGQRVLVYGTRESSGIWSTGCSRTRPSGEGDNELRTLRALARRESGGLVDGYLVTVDGEREVTNRHPGFRVTLRPRSGRAQVLSAVTNSAGFFQFDWVAPGDYIIELDGGALYQSEQQEGHVRTNEKCLTLPKFVLRSR